ncbi:MAG: hypothetical protein DYG89_22415 [Caldilinea sp. CFX5]|nr:hypothetical protein [Caldilinea sp. CFX5]
MRQTKTIPLLIFLCYLALYSFANYPAISRAWWYRDDFALTETPRPNKGQLDTLKHGRPVNYLLLMTYQWEEGEQWATANVLLRLLQVAFHALAALVAGALLADRRRPWVSYCAVLLFLLYPFNGEPVLWRSALMNPLAALLSLLGVALLSRSSLREQPAVAALPTAKQARTRLVTVGGILLIALAMVTHQQAALAGLVVWVVAVGQWAMSPKLPTGWWRGTLWVVGGYALGALLSRLCIYLFFGPAGRAALSTAWWEKVQFALTLNRLYLWSDYYPAWLAGLHLLLVAGGMAAAGFYLRRSWPGLLALPALVTLFVLPYAAVLVTAESWPAWRVTYLAPFLLIGAWLLLDRCLASYRLFRFGNFFLLALLLAGYVPMAWRNAAEYVMVFDQDLAEVRAIEAWAATQPNQPTAIVVATAPDYIRTWNPYAVQYMQADSKVSAFLADWTIAPMFTFFTDLTPRQYEPETKHACVQLCRHPPDDPPFSRHLLQSDNVICICP